MICHQDLIYKIHQFGYFHSWTRFFVVILSLSGLDIHVLKGSAVLIDDNSSANISGYWVLVKVPYFV
jgi:hypothetical protein